MSTLKLIQDVALRRALGDRCFSKVTLAINIAGAATIKTTSAAILSVDGVFGSAVALAAQSMAVTHGLNGAPVSAGPTAYVQPVSTAVFYVIAQNLAGAVAVIQGGFNGQVVTMPTGISFTSQGEMPAVPVGFAPIGYVRVATNASTTFTSGVTILDAAGVTATYVDITILPSAI